MRDDDVQLSAEERAAFAAIEDQLAARRAGRRTAWNRPKWPLRRPRGSSWIELAVGTALLFVGGLVGERPLVGLAGFVMVLLAAHHLLRRFTCASVARRWRHRIAPQSPPEHVPEA